MDVVVEGLRFERRGRTVLDVPALRFASHGTTAVLGPNGSGKTTLLRLIAGLERPAAGRMLVVGEAGARPPAPADIALAFQEPVFVSGSVRRNLDLALRFRDLGPVARAARILEAARECGIEAVLDRPARQLSSGEARRASLARALALRAPVTLLDEPLAAIDRHTRLQLLDDLPRLLATFAATTVLVTHDREEAFRLADDLVVLVDGRVRAAGPKAAVYARPPDRVTAELLGYTVVPVGGGEIAVPPGGFRRGDGGLALTMLVERVVDMGNHRHALGTVEGARVDLRLPDGQAAPESGERIPIGAPTSITLG